MTHHSPIYGKQKILLVCEKNLVLLKELKGYLKKFDNDVYVSPKLPQALTQFDYCFIINDAGFIDRIHERNQYKNITCIIEHNAKKAQSLAKKIRQKGLAGIKVIAAPPDYACSTYHIEEVVWFAVSQTPEIFLILKSLTPAKKPPVAPPVKKGMPFKYRLYLWFEKFLSKKNITLAAFLLILIYHTAFLIPLSYGGLITYSALRKAQDNDFVGAVALVEQSRMPVSLAKKMYAFARPTFLLFSIAQKPDDLFSIHEKTLSIIYTVNNLQTSANTCFTLVLKKNKSPEETKKLADLIASLKDQLGNLEISVAFLNQKIPDTLPVLKSAKDKLLTVSDMISKVKRVTPYLPELLAQNSEKKYLLLFANNMELRPGGGFIGSYGVLTMRNLTFEGIDIYDVYDADGQLTAHVEPPAAIKTYLSQPHWFLRDSAFSPDFYENYFQAKFFLNKEQQFSDFNGGILITTSAIQNILKAFGPIYLSDFGEKVTADNFYIKTQLHAEKEFFPGSTQKKSFLAALMRQILVNMDSVHPKDFLASVFTSAEEKQMAIYMESEGVQKLFDSFYWSGRIIEPHCPAGINNCYTDFMFPYDANLGVNKANFYLNRSMDVAIHADTAGIVYSKLDIKFRNDSIQDIFPGGVYHNYFQILIPRDSVVQEVSVDDVPLPVYDQELGQFKKVGFYFEIPLQTTRKVTILYHSLTAMKPGKAIYQLLFQKQIGSINNDLHLQITLPDNIFLVNQNFSPLVNGNRINYNTELSADKIFFIELLKQ